MIEIGTKVLVTTEFRGVFYGKLLARSGNTVTLGNARNCIYWSKQMRGFLGLARYGPDSECRIGPEVERLELMGVTSITACSLHAVAAWETGPWS